MSEPRVGGSDERPSLETLVETGLLDLESLHPGGLDLSRELASLCNLEANANVLDVACGTGETALCLAEEFAVRMRGIDHSRQMVARAHTKADERGLAVGFIHGDAHELPFPDGAFDAAICECTLCLLDKATVLAEMTRVVGVGGSVAMHDLYWQAGAPDALKQSLLELEGEAPETLDGWKRQFAAAGLVDIRTTDKSDVKARWLRNSHRQLGLSGQLALGLDVIRRWGVSGLWAVLRAERVMASAHLGYVIVIGTKPTQPPRRDTAGAGMRQ